ncbi:MAG TPA: Xaa-Pro peptidase family protein, partial [Thermoanaerobaculia bacterium]|nr:Xaa-Pro peptidase family protein [Thermoanaerobaculia bacterium]
GYKMRLTRRRLVLSAGAGAAAALLRSPATLTAAQEAPPLPPPLKPDVFRDRQARLRAGAKARGLDALFVTPSTNLAYSANLAIGRSERLTALLLFTDGPSVLVTPTFEEANHKRNAVADEVRTWQEDEDPIPLVAKLLNGKKSLGAEGSTSYGTVSALASATSTRVEDANAVFDALRMIKSDEEQAFIREAGKRTNAAIEGTHKRMRAGMSENDVAKILEEEFTKQGVRGGGLVQFGPSSAFPHGAPAERRLAKGDAVLIDCGCKVRGYSSDITRTVSFGPPSDEFRKVYGIVDKAQMAGIEALKAGVNAEDVDRAARKVIEDAGYGQFFTHRVGHGLGMDGHEHPYLVRGNKKPLAAGNVQTIEPGIYMPEKFGVRIEDDYAVQKDGAKSLSVRPGEMVVVG